MYEVYRQWIGHVRNINIQAWLRGFRVKIANFSSFFCPPLPKKDLNTKKTTPNIEVWPESLGAMLEYWYIERGLLHWVLSHLNSEWSCVLCLGWLAGHDRIWNHTFQFNTHCRKIPRNLGTWNHNMLLWYVTYAPIEIARGLGLVWNCLKPSLKNKRLIFT